jgi:hypothetical protein
MAATRRTHQPIGLLARATATLTLTPPSNPATPPHPAANNPTTSMLRNEVGSHIFDFSKTEPNNRQLADAKFRSMTHN